MPKGKPVHSLSDVQGNRAQCAHCGPVDVQWRTARGRRTPRCGPARRAEPGRDRWHTAKGAGYTPPPRHGLTPDRARAMVAMVGTCEGCGLADATGVDHDHRTGVVRGALCGRCNLTLGWVHDNPATLRALAAYLDRYVHPALRSAPPA